MVCLAPAKVSRRNTRKLSSECAAWDNGSSKRDSDFAMTSTSPMTSAASALDDTPPFEPPY